MRNTCTYNATRHRLRTHDDYFSNSFQLKVRQSRNALFTLTFSSKKQTNEFEFTIKGQINLKLFFQVDDSSEKHMDKFDFTNCRVKTPKKNSKLTDVYV